MKIILRRSVPAAPVFRCPAGGDPRTAVVHRLLRAARPNRVVHPDAPDLLSQLASFRPEALAASYDHLLALHPALDASMKPDRAIVVFSCAATPLTQTQRDHLWDLFEVPVFEQLLDEGGALLASECEAHDGLHLARKGATSLAGELTDRRCGCGSAATRIAPASAVKAASWSAA